MNSNSNYHETRFKLLEERKIVWSVLTPFLQKKFPMGRKVLELGCGYGDFINNVEAEVRYAIDASSMGSHLNEGIHFLQAPLPCSFNFTGGSLSTVFASNLLEHLDRKDLDALFDEVHAQLGAGGLFISLTPNFKRAYKDYFDDYTHLTALTEVALADWLEAKGFDVIFCHPGFMPFSIKGSRLPVNKFLVRAYLASPVKPMGKQMLVVAKKR